MRPFLITWQACALLVTLTLGAAALAGPVDNSAEAAIEAAARRVMAEHDLPGLAIGVTVDGRQRFYHYGVASKASGQPVDAATLFEIGSVSKTFTVTLAAYAEALGALSLADSPSRHLPELAGSRIDDITLLQLATHTAGDFPLQLPETVTRIEDLPVYYRAWRPSQAPGRTRTYANPSIGLLGLAAARSLDTSYVEALEGRLLPLLGLHDTYPRLPAAAQQRYAQGYTRDGQPARLSPAPLADEAYGLRTTSADLLRFVEAHLQSPADPALAQALATTRTGHYRVGPMTQALVWEYYPHPAPLADLQAGNASRMALESQPVTPIAPPLPPQEAVWVNKTGSTNGFGAYVAFVPAERFGVVILANRHYPNEARVALARQVYEAVR